MDYSGFLNVSLFRAFKTIALFAIVFPYVFRFRPFTGGPFKRDILLLEFFAFFLAFSMFIIAAIPSFLALLDQ